MKRIGLILLLSLATVPLFAQDKKDDQFECNFFHCEVLDGAVENVHNGVKNLSNRIKEKIQEKKESRQNRQTRKQDSNQDQQEAAQQLQEEAEQNAVPAEGLPLKQSYFDFNGQRFYEEDTSTQDEMIRQVFVSQEDQILILRQYPQALNPPPEDWPLGDGLPADPEQIIFHDNFFTSSINHGQEVTVASSRWPKDESFQDVSLVRTVYLGDIIQQYIYRFRVEDPSQNSSGMFKKALHALEAFDLKKLQRR